jgi:hypothetical protein
MFKANKNTVIAPKKVVKGISIKDVRSKAVKLAKKK